jgi:hypothetical protein
MAISCMSAAQANNVFSHLNNFVLRHLPIHDAETFVKQAGADTDFLTAAKIIEETVPFFWVVTFGKRVGIFMSWYVA